MMWSEYRGKKSDRKIEQDGRREIKQWVVSEGQKENDREKERERGGMRVREGLRERLSKLEDEKKIKLMKIMWWLLLDTWIECLVRY